MDVKEVRNIHAGGRVFITASGPSLLEFEPELLKGEQIIAINETLRRFPWAQYSVALDHGPYEEALVHDSILFTMKTKTYLPNVIHLGRDNKRNSQNFTFDLTGGIFCGGTSTFVGLEAAVWMGFKDIYLCGLDLCRSINKTHFYGIQDRFDHKCEANFPLMKKSFEQAATVLSHINVVNCSLVSTLTCFPKIDIHEVV